MFIKKRVLFTVFGIEMKTYKYDTISRLYLEPTQSKVNIYGVITELHESRNTTSTNNRNYFVLNKIIQF